MHLSGTSRPVARFGVVHGRRRRSCSPPSPGRASAGFARRRRRSSAAAARTWSSSRSRSRLASTTCTAPSTRSPRASRASTGASTTRSRTRAIVRYDAYEDTGGHQSASLALLNGARTGIVITAIQGRDYARIYVKELDRGKPAVALSPEEQEAVERAMGRAQAAPGRSLSRPAGSRQQRACRAGRLHFT